MEVALHKLPIRYGAWLGAAVLALAAAFFAPGRAAAPDEGAGRMRARDGSIPPSVGLFEGLFEGAFVGWLAATRRTGSRDARHAGGRRASDEQYRRLAESIVDYALIGLDSRGRIEAWTHGAEHLFGYSADEVLGQNRSLLFTEEDRRRDFPAFALATARRHGSFEAATWCVRKGGARFWASTAITPVTGADGAVEGFSELVRDISERKQFEEALARAARDYRGLFESAHDAIILFDPEGETVLDVNQRACELYGFERREFVGMSLESISKNVEIGQRRIGETIASDSRVSFETVQHRSDGSDMFLEINATTVEYKGRSVIMSVNRDITDRKRAEAAIRRLNDELEGRVVERTGQLEAANRELEAFSYSVSHDLRAPLRAIDGFSRILLEAHTDRLDEEGREYLDLVRENAQRMGDLIDDLLAFARLSRQPLRTQIVDTTALVRRALDEIEIERSGRSVEVIVGELPDCHADPALLAQVFVNLLSNALKYTRRVERARVEVGCVSGGDGTGEKVYYVRDNGAGFDMRYVHKLFGVFQRLHRIDEYEGTGVGLAIVHRVVTRHGGRVWAEAEVNRGATFYFSLPPEAPR